jgi:hypothetical protein
LPGLDAVKYVQGDNWLGVALAALMRIPAGQAAWLGAEALRRIQSAPLTEQQRFLLGECVQAYLPLDEEGQREFARLLETDTYRGVQAMNTTWYEKGIEKGRRESLREQLEIRFGPLMPEVLAHLERLPGERLQWLSKAILTARTLDELGLRQSNHA